MSTTPRFRLRAAALAAAVVASWLLIGPEARSRYIRPDIEQVPIDRIIKNLEAAVKKDAKDTRAKFNLARAHGMAYASKAEKAPVWKGKDSAGIWFGYEPRHVPFPPVKGSDKKKAEEPENHLPRAIALFREVVKAEPSNLTAQLGLAWSLQQAGKKQEAVADYRKVIEAGWKQEKDKKVAGLGWHSVTAEAAGYLIPLLDKEKDKAEIATLQERTAAMKKVIRPITPIVIPLRDGMGAGDLVDRNARVAFDADGSGASHRWTWVTRDAGWLVYDPQRAGKVTSGLQLFGNVTFWMFWENGYQALSALDDDGDGSLKGKELEGLAIWRDANGDGKCDPGEVRPLAAWGIEALSCRAEKGPAVTGCAAWAKAGATFRGGRVRPTYDVILDRR